MKIIELEKLLVKCKSVPIVCLLFVIVEFLFGFVYASISCLIMHAKSDIK